VAGLGWVLVCFLELGWWKFGEIKDRIESLAVAIFN
jgi:hypothetical protein